MIEIKIYINKYVGSVIEVAMVVTRCGKASIDSKLRSII